MKEITNRQIIALNEHFFNDGAWYVLSSTSLGGSDLTANSIVEKLQSDNKSDIEYLLQQGICLPLFFPGDCALDDAAIIIGELTEKEEREWIGRIQGYLEIPCGEFILLGGGGSEEDWEIALTHFQAPDPNFINFQKIKLTPGKYLIEIYAFLGSMNANFIFETIEKKQSLINWLKLSNFNHDNYPDWMNYYLENKYVDGYEFGLQDYLIRLNPLQETIAIPPLDQELNWCSEFEIREPTNILQGILRKDYNKKHLNLF